MSDKNKAGCNVSLGGLGLFPLMFLILFTLKLCGVLDEGWTWWWVTAPLWVPALVGLAIFVVVSVVVFTGACLALWLEKMK